MKPATLAFLLCTVLGAPSAMAMPTVAEFHHQTMDYFSKISVALFSSSAEGYELWDQILSEGDRARVEQIRDYAARYLANNPASKEFSEIKAQAEKILQKNAMLTEALAYKNATSSEQGADGNDEQVDAIDITALDPATVDLYDAGQYDVSTPSLASKTSGELVSVADIYDHFNSTTKPLMDECEADIGAFMSRHYGQYVSRPCIQERIEMLSGFSNIREAMTPYERVCFGLYALAKTLAAVASIDRKMAEEHGRLMAMMLITEFKRSEENAQQ